MSIILSMVTALAPTARTQLVGEGAIGREYSNALTVRRRGFGIPRVGGPPSQDFPTGVELLKRVFGRFAPVGIAVLVLAMTGCAIPVSNRSQPKAEVKSFRPSTNAPFTAVAVTVLQAQVMRIADVYATTVAQAADDFSARAGTPEARLAGLRWKLGQATSVYVDATGPNPVLNALDMLVLVSLARMVVEDYHVKVFGDDALPLLETHRKLEEDAWLRAGVVLKPAQKQELRDLIQEWRQKNPDQRYIGAIRFKEFVTALGKMPTQGSTKPTSIFSLLFLDPLAGLDPTAAAIEETRLLGERAMYYTQRMPMLLSWQTELLAYQLAVQPESKQVLSDAARVAASVESFAKTAQQVPQLVNDQREAAIRQLLDGFASQEVKGRELLTETRQTITAANEMAVSVNNAVKSLDDFVRLVSPADSNRVAHATNAKPFDVLEYGRAATQVGDAAKELNELLTRLNQTTPQLAQLGQQTTADANQVVDHAFRRGLILILVLLIGSVAAGLTHRLLTNKLTGAGRKPTVPNP